MKNLFALLFFGLLITALSCEKDQEFNDLQNKTTAIQQDVLSSQGQEWVGELPPLTQRKPYPRKKANFRNGDCLNPLTPTSVELTLEPGQSYVEVKDACVPPVPPKADIVYAFDITGSMGQELFNVVEHCDQIAMWIIDNIGDPRIAVVSHMDYDGSYPYDCTIGGSVVPYGTTGDYPYNLDQPFSSDIAGDVHNAIEALYLAGVGHGMDSPEDYARVLWETYNDPSFTSPTTGWRDDAAQIIIYWLDNVPHDCDDGTGPDPGRNGVFDDGGDDIDFDAVISYLESEKIHLAVIHSGPTAALTYWQGLESDYLTVTDTEDDGTIPGTTIEEIIAEIIENTSSTVGELTLSLVGTAYEDWVSISPDGYTDPATDGTTYQFDVEFTVPIGAALGEHTFQLVLERDGEFLAYQDVTINVIPKYVPVDIKPTSCRNPINLKSGGVVSVAINGMRRLDVRRIDPTTVTLLGIEPLRFGYEDVSAPYWPFIGKQDPFDCTEEGPDGFMDLVFKFNKKDLIEAIGDVDVGDVLVLPLEGFMYSGIPIYGEDVVQVVNKSKA